MAKILSNEKPLRGEDLIGRKFGRLTVTSFAGRETGASRKKMWNCSCECGGVKTVRHFSLTHGECLSCRCLIVEGLKERQTTHGLSKHKLHNHWAWMKARCNNPNHADYPRYGGRGIKILEPWQSDFMAFYTDMLPAWKRGLTIERKDNNGPYCKDNCRWANRSDQQRNKSCTTFMEHNGVRRPAIEWDEILGFPVATTRGRLSRGWTPDEVVGTPLGKNGKHKIT